MSAQNKREKSYLTEKNYKENKNKVNGNLGND